jgi:metal-dependent amidase/aminoacylase/carboxypeptidase family protein
MTQGNGNQPTEILLNLDAILPELETIYKDIHAHPELSMQEMRTAGIAASHLKASGFEVTTRVGKTGVRAEQLIVHEG